MRQVKAKVISNEQVAPRYYKMRLHDSYLARTLHPGQFIEARCSDSSDPLLRRPFGPYKIFVFKDSFEILYEVIGKATTILSGKKAGDFLDIIGPLGNGFKIGHLAEHTLIVGGGIGAGPLVALAQRLVGKQPKTKLANYEVYIGAKTKDALLCEDDFKELGVNVTVTTDDGSKGKKGFVTQILREWLARVPYDRRAVIYACGPRPMMRAVAELAKDHHIYCQLLLEEYMACGVGVCLGCPVKVRKDLVDHEYKMVCKDGPVFNAEKIIW
jgi:dihydroorotate dehydrogenase electron transfer subunit